MCFRACCYNRVGFLHEGRGCAPELEVPLTPAKRSMNCPRPDCGQWNHVENDACVFCDTKLEWAQVGRIRLLSLLLPAKADGCVGA